MYDHTADLAIPQVISGKIEEISIDEQVDVIISEPMGYMLLNERCS